MGDEERGFIAAICADPADDVRRLAYADWLQENAGTVKRCSGTHRHAGKMGINHGVWHDTDPNLPHHHCDEKCVVGDGRRDRAEFIRVQIELANRQDCGHGATNTVYLDGSCGVCPLRYRERDLIKAFAHTWFDNRQSDFVVIDYHDAHEDPPSCLVMGKSRPPRVCSYATVSRGFVESVTCTGQWWVELADTLTWNPKQTVECPEVKWQVVRGVVDPDTLRRRKQDKYKDCGPCAPWCKGGCGGTARVIRPCPETAHPITRVTLTSRPNFFYAEFDGAGQITNWRDTTDPLWLAEWVGEIDNAQAERERASFVRMFEAKAAYRWPGIEFSFEEGVA